jgi:flagellar L-ring protein precursor FlgH
MRTLLALLLISLPHATARAQTSSLYVAPLQLQQIPGDGYTAVESPLAPAIAAHSFTAVAPPDPLRFAVHDLITVIIRESTSTDFEASLDTNKETKIDGELSDFPDLNLRKLIDFQLTAGEMTEPVKVGLDYSNEFKGDGSYSRSENITGRITAQIIDVKPNGLLVLEARKFIQSDKETLDLVLTGTCRPEDVAVDNTVLSTVLYDLRLDKQHTGELRGSTKKGLFTKVLETIFNF